MELKDLKSGDYVKETSGGYRSDFKKSIVSRVTKTLIILKAVNMVGNTFDVKFSKVDGCRVPYESMSPRIYPWNNSHELELRELIRIERNRLMLNRIADLDCKSLSDSDYSLLSKLIIKYKGASNG